LIEGSILDSRLGPFAPGPLDIVAERCWLLVAQASVLLSGSWAAFSRPGLQVLNSVVWV